MSSEYTSNHFTGMASMLATAGDLSHESRTKLIGDACAMLRYAAALTKPADAGVTKTEVINACVAYEQWGKDNNGHCYAHFGSMQAALESFAARHAQPVDGMTTVTRQDTGNYGCIISLLEMEEDGDPVAEVEKLIAARHARQGEVVAEQKLDAPAMVGRTTFGKGVSWSTVISTAQRHFEWRKEPGITPEQVAAFYIAFPHLAPKEADVRKAAQPEQVKAGDWDAVRCLRDEIREAALGRSSLHVWADALTAALPTTKGEG